MNYASRHFRGKRLDSSLSRRWNRAHNFKVIIDRSVVDAREHVCWCGARSRGSIFDHGRSQPRFSLRYDVPFDSFAFLRVVQSLWLSTRADIDASAFLALLANSACRAHFKRTFCIKGAEEKRLQSHMDTEEMDKAR